MVPFIQEEYKLDENEIYIYSNDKIVHTAFSDKMQNDLLSLEDESWWFRYRANVIEQIAQKYLNKDVFVYDVGGGNAFTSSFMQKKGWDLCLIEPNYQACLNAKTRGLKTIICGTVSEENFDENYFEQVMLLDVLEHIKDDVNFLKILRKKIKKGGRLLVTVPASMKLWSSEDDFAGHFRRYDLKSFAETAHAAGWKISYINYFFEFLFMPIFLVRHMGEKLRIVKPTGQRSEKESNEVYNKQFKVNNGLVDKLLSVLEKWELGRLKRKRHIYFGSSIICVLK